MTNTRKSNTVISCLFRSFQVRIEPAGVFSPANDQLRGTASYGTYPSVSDPAVSDGTATPDQASATFSVPFSNLQYNQFLFESGDRSQWLMMDKKEIDKCDAIVASGIDRPFAPWNPTILHSSATGDGNCEACEPAGAGWTKVYQGTIAGSNIHLYGPSCADNPRATCFPGSTDFSDRRMTLAECKDKCDQFDGFLQADGITLAPDRDGPVCAAFEFGGPYGGLAGGSTGVNSLYQDGDCQPQNVAEPIAFNGDVWNLDLYVKGDSSELHAASGYTVQQYCRTGRPRTCLGMQLQGPYLFGHAATT